MRLIDFLESKFTKNSLQNQAQFNPYQDSEAKASQTIMNLIRGTLKGLAIPKLLIEFLAVQLRILPEPEDAKEMIRKMNEESKKKQEQVLAEHLKAQEDAQKKLDLENPPETLP